MKAKQILCVLLVALFALVGCQTAPAAAPAAEAAAPAEAEAPVAQEAAAPAEEAKVYEIGVILKSADDPWTAWQGKELELAAANYPQFHLEFIECDFDQAKAISAMENMIIKEKDLIIIQPIDQTGIAYMVDQAAEAGIPVISISNPIDSEHSYNIVADAYSEGKLLTQHMIELLPENSSIVELEGQLGMAIATDRHQGVLDAIKESGRTDITLLDSQTGEWMKDKAMTVTEDWIQLYGDKINGVVSANDYMALGAMEALKPDMIKNVIVCGIDCLPETCIAIKDGTFNFTVVNDAPLSAKMALETALKLIGGEAVEHDQVVGSSVCDINNVDEWIEIHKASGNLQ